MAQGRSGSVNAAAHEFVAVIRPWAIRWGLPGLEDGIHVRFDARLRGSLARCRPEQGTVALHSTLRAQSKAAIAPVLCHEAAHVAAYHLYGGAVRPHGMEWRTLVEAAGFSPFTRIRPSELGLPATLGAQRSPMYPDEQRRPSRSTFRHYCEVCHMSRSAMGPVSAWRCAECVAAGLEGRLTIIRQSE
jgi:hypothetical protein